MVVKFAWCCIPTLLLSCMLACLTGSSIRKKCMFVYSSVCKKIFACSSICKHVLLRLIPLFIPYIVTPCLLLYLYHQSLMKRWHQIHKPPSLPWCMIISDASDRERRQGYENARSKFWAGMRALSTAGENCAEVTGRWWWEIWINSDYLLDPTWLEDKSAWIFRGAVRATGRLGRENLWNF